MLIEWILNALKTVFFGLFGVFHIPPLPTDFSDAVLTFVSTIFDTGGSLISLVLPWRIVTIGIPIVIVLVSAKHIYHFVMWIVRKIPLVGMS